MLEQTRRSASIFVYLIFGLLIVIFVWGINPSNRGGEGGCTPASNTEMTVDGVASSESAWQMAFAANGAGGRQKVYVALDQIIRRELLAQAAEARGIRTTGDVVDEDIKRGNFFLGGQRHDFKRQFFDEDGELFMFKQFKSWVDRLNVSTGSYREEQARGLQAAIMNELIASSVPVSRDEALADYLYENNTVTYDVVAFSPGKYRMAMRLTDADTRRFLEGHAAEVQARYKADERTYKAVKPQFALREIFIPKTSPEAAKPADDKAAKPADDKAAKPADDKADKAAKPAKPAGDKAAKPAGDKTADKKPADKKPADKKPAVGDAHNPRGLPPDVAKAKLEAVRQEIAAGKLTFPDAEKQLAADAADAAPAENGDRGWRSSDNAGLGEKAVNDAVKVLKPGEMTPVIVTERGAYLVIATDKREGDLSFDQVKMEIAAELAKDEWSKEAAKRDALEALAKAEASPDKSLDKMFDREKSGDELTPEQREQIMQQLRQQHGSLERHEQDEPVAWYADADGAGTSPAKGTGGAAAMPTPGSAAPTPATSTPAAGAGAGSGGAAPPATAPAIPAPPAAPAVIEPSKDQLPQFGEIPKAKVNRLGPSPRQVKMPGVGSSKDAINALFDELAPGSLAKKIYEGEAGSYIVLQLINRSQPKVEDFDKMADTEINRMQEARGRAAVHGWLKDRCETLAKAGKIRPSAEKTREVDDKGNPAPRVYHPCMFFDALDR